MKRACLICGIIVIVLLAVAYLFGIGSRGGLVLWPGKVQFFAHDRVLAVLCSDPNSVFVVQPLPDNLIADCRKWLSSANFELRDIWVDADTIHNAYLDQTEHRDVLSKSFYQLTTLIGAAAHGQTFGRATAVF